MADDSPIRSKRMRNKFDHFDEKIDPWWKKTERGNSIDVWIGQLPDVTGGSPDDTLRVYDPETGRLLFWGEEFEARAVTAEAEQIIPARQTIVGLPRRFGQRFLRDQLTRPR